MTTRQIAALNSQQVAALGTMQISVLETQDVAVLGTKQIRALTSEQILYGLTTQQISALTTGQVEAFSSDQIAVFSTDQIQYLTVGTPLVLDLNGDGGRTKSFRAGTQFDLFATGQKVHTGWVSSGDGLLVLDRNGDGVINDGSELFGSATALANGQKASDGYAALRDLDSNQDGVMNSGDAAFTNLKVWVDADSDGSTDSGELRSLDSLGIRSVSTVATVELSKDNGNLVGLVSSYETTDGNTHAAADVWFVADKAAAMAPDAVAGAGAAAQAEAQPPAAPEPVVGLRGQVLGLAQAINSFGSGPEGSSNGGENLLGDAGSAKAGTLAVVGMVDAMKQFDANGNLLNKSTSLAASVPNPVSLPKELTDSSLLAVPSGKLSG